MIAGCTDFLHFGVDNCYASILEHREKANKPIQNETHKSLGFMFYLWETKTCRIERVIFFFFAKTKNLNPNKKLIFPQATKQS